MSRDELVNAYIDGSVSRRTFIRRLVTAGVSIGAAVSYAHLLSPDRAGASEAGPDFYDKPLADQNLPSSTPQLASASSSDGVGRKRRRKKRKKRP